MKAKIKGIEIEGSPKEFKELLKIGKKYKKHKKKGTKCERRGKWSKGKKLSKAHKEAIGRGVRKAAKRKGKGKTQRKSPARKKYTYKRNIKKQGAKWTTKQDEILIREVKDGRKVKNVAKMLGRSYESAKNRIKVLRYKYMQSLKK